MGTQNLPEAARGRKPCAAIIAILAFCRWKAASRLPLSSAAVSRAPKCDESAANGGGAI
ncbi:unnamed protein product [Ectocarpus sp. CCAP 1310/34]|nr:unnamed protein product [Ectocarpus sp. CCAP 1310/34]